MPSVNPSRIFFERVMASDQHCDHGAAPPFNTNLISSGQRKQSFL
jgi:hypothetical protein